MATVRASTSTGSSVWLTVRMSMSAGPVSAGSTVTTTATSLPWISASKADAASASRAGTEFTKTLVTASNETATTASTPTERRKRDGESVWPSESGSERAAQRRTTCRLNAAAARMVMNRATFATSRRP